MRKTRFLVSGSATLVTALAAALSAPMPTASAATPPQLVSVQFSRASVAVVGLNTVTVTVSVHLTDDTGVVETRDFEGLGAPLPIVQLTNVSGPHSSGAPTSEWRDIDLTSGTATDGTWSSTVLIPSTFDGQWQVTRVTARDDEGNTLSVDPRTVGQTATLTVDGSHQPGMTMGFSPNPVVDNQPTVQIKGRVVDIDTLAPVPNLLLTLGLGSTENCGAFGYGGSAATRTDAAGYYSFGGLRADEPYYCVINTAPQLATSIDFYRTSTRLFRFGVPRIQPVISAAVDRTPIRVGESVAVRGNVTPLHAAVCGGCGAGRRVFLQRLAGGVWHTVNSTPVRVSGRYTLMATPPSAGNHRYRVFLPQSFNFLAASSRTVLIGAV